MSIVLLEKPVEASDEANPFIQGLKEWKWSDELFAKPLPDEKKPEETDALPPDNVVYSSVIYELTSTAFKTSPVGMSSYCSCSSCRKRRDAYVYHRQSQQAYVLTDADLLDYLVRVGEAGTLGYAKRPRDCFLARVLNAKYPQFSWQVMNDDAHAISRLSSDGSFLHTYSILLSSRQREMVHVFDVCQSIRQHPKDAPVPRALFVEVWNTVSNDPIEIACARACFVRDRDHEFYAGYGREEEQRVRLFF